jgi:hypothetical protein
MCIKDTYVLDGIDGIDGIMCIKDTYVRWYRWYNMYKRHICCMLVCKYVKKTLLELGFICVCVSRPLHELGPERCMYHISHITEGYVCMCVYVYTHTIIDTIRHHIHNYTPYTHTYSYLIRRLLLWYTHTYLLLRISYSTSVDTRDCHVYVYVYVLVCVVCVCVSMCMTYDTYEPMTYDTYLLYVHQYGIYGIICIKDTYVVCKYVKKTLISMGFRHLPAVCLLCWALHWWGIRVLVGARLPPCIIIIGVLSVDS